MLLWELIFERRPYEDINFSMMIDYVTNGGREKLQFDNNSSIMVNIQKSIKKIIKKGRYLFEIYFLLLFIYDFYIFFYHKLK